MGKFSDTIGITSIAPIFKFEYIHHTILTLNILKIFMCKVLIKTPEESAKCT